MLQSSRPQPIQGPILDPTTRHILQDTILRYGRLKICATFSFGLQQEHQRNPGYPRSSSWRFRSPIHRG